ncbi:hypothetical protein [Desulfonatronospira thiodismutans]|uniref:hypothetical protein n=1 Tax=Desulfonatronospira thiodismutans TaxID=488939 RepID=UPI001ABF717C|nr:hypothetical protein [Desulfonatronospira thiodismutans]
MPANNPAPVFTDSGEKVMPAFRVIALEKPIKQTVYRLHKLHLKTLNPLRQQENPEAFLMRNPALIFLFTAPFSQCMKTLSKIKIWP